MGSHSTRPIIRHHYVSTACLHGRHERCRRFCKFCDEPCQCSRCDHVEPRESALSASESGIGGSEHQPPLETAESHTEAVPHAHFRASESSAPFLLHDNGLVYERVGERCGFNAEDPAGPCTSCYRLVEP